MKKLVACAKDLNEVLGLEPAIKVVGVKKEDLLGKIKEAVTLIDPEEDEEKLTEETIETLRGLGLWPEEDAPEDDEDADEDADEDEGDEGDEDEDDEPEEKPAPKSKGKTKPEKPAKEKAPKPEKVKTEKVKTEKVKKDRAASAYGTAVILMCANTNMTVTELIAAVKAAGINTEAGKSAITTAYSAVKKISGLLLQHGWKKGK